MAWAGGLNEEVFWLLWAGVNIPVDVGDEQWEQEFWEPRKIREEKVCAQYAMMDNPVMVMSRQSCCSCFAKKPMWYTWFALTGMWYTWFALTGKFWHSTSYDQYIPGKKSAVSQIYWLLFCLTGSPKAKNNKAERERACVACYLCVCVWGGGVGCSVCVCVCVLDGEGSRVVASRALVVV